MQIQSKSLFTEPTLLWEGKTTVAPNVWGLADPIRGLRFSPLYGAYFPAQGRMSHLGIILLSVIIIPSIYIVLSYFSIFLSIIGVILYSGALLYWVLIREIKYYRLTKSTRYNITNTEVHFINKIYKKPRTLAIPIKEIKQIHLVPFKSGDKESGSIYLYLDRKIKTYNLTNKERSSAIVIERVEDYQEAYRLLKRLITSFHSTLLD